MLSPVSPPRTASYPSSMRRTYFSGPDQPTALRVYGTPHELPLLAGQTEITLGREGDLRFDQCPNPHLSRLHARLTREGNYLLVEDISAQKNPIIFESRAAASFSIAPGDGFRIGKAAYYAVTDEMRMSRTRIERILGETRYAAIDDCLIVAVKQPDRPIALVAEPGCEQEDLAYAIHTCSQRRRGHLVTVPPASAAGAADRSLIGKARDGTLLVQVPVKTRFDQAFVAEAVAPESRVRLIICIHASGKLAKSFPPPVSKEAFALEIAPLRKRKKDIPMLLDKWFVEARSELRFAKMNETTRDKLVSYRWKGNLKELHEASYHLRMLSTYKSEREAERDETMTRSESRAWRRKFQLPLPIIPETTNPTKRRKSNGT